MSTKPDLRGTNSQITHFKPGESGNPLGRPKGSRSAFSAAFIGDMQASWAQHGASVLDQVAKRDPSRYLGVAASLCPRDVQVSLEARTSGLTEEDLSILKAIKAELPGANDMTPTAVFEHTVNALRAYGAKTIESE